MRGRSLLPIALLVAACADEPDRPLEPEQPSPVKVTAHVNVQLGDTPAGLRPVYIVTGTVRAEQDSARVAAKIDSIVVHHQRAGGAWSRSALFLALPADGLLPFNAVAGEEYGVWAVLYARGFGVGDTAAARAEFTVTGRGYSP